MYWLCATNPWNSKDKEIFAMLDEIILADKEKPLLNSTNIKAITKDAHLLYFQNLPIGYLNYI